MVRNSKLKIIFLPPRKSKMLINFATLPLSHFLRESRFATPMTKLMLKTKGWTKCSPLKVSVQMRKTKPLPRFRALLLLHTHSPVAYGIERTPWIGAPSQFGRLPHGFAGDTTFSCPFLKKMNKEDKLEERIVTPGQNTPSATAPKSLPVSVVFCSS